MSAVGPAPSTATSAGGPAGIVVALDPARPTTRALEVALAISGDGGGLRGIFIESAPLLRLAGHPCALEVAPGPLGAATRVLTRETLERDLRRRAEDVRRVFESGVRSARRGGDFVVRRGAIVEELTRAAVDAGLLALGVSRRDSPGAWWGADVARLAAAGPDRLLFVPDELELHDGTVLIAGADRGGEACERAAVEVATRTGLRLQDLVSRRPLEAASLLQSAWSLRARVMVFAAQQHGLTVELLHTVLQRASCAVLVVR